MAAPPKPAVVVLLVLLAAGLFVLLAWAIGGTTTSASGGPSTARARPTEEGESPRALVLAETVVGEPALAWAFVSVPPYKPTHTLALSRPAARVSVWAVEGPAQQPVLTVLLRPDDRPPTDTLGPLPAYHAAEKLLVIFHDHEKANTGAEQVWETAQAEPTAAGPVGIVVRAQG